MKVLFSPQVRQYFKELEEILFKEEYFGFEESAILYVRDLIFEIEKELPNKYKRQAPPYFERYGPNLSYSTFRKNKNTTWYAFFTIYKTNEGLIYLVRYISNNHVIAQHL